MNTRNLMFALLLGAGALLPLGCARIDHKAPIQHAPISMGSTLGRDFDRLDTFEDSQKKWFLFWYLVPLGDTNAWTIAEENLHGADGIVGMRSDTNFDAVDWFVGLVTLGLVGTWDIDVAGERVRFHRTAPSTAAAPAPSTN